MLWRWFRVRPGRGFGSWFGGTCSAVARCLAPDWEAPGYRLACDTLLGVRV